MNAEEYLSEFFELPESWNKEDDALRHITFNSLAGMLEYFASQSRWISAEEPPEVGQRVLVIGWCDTDWRYDSSVYENDSEPQSYIVVWEGKNNCTVASIDDGAMCGNYQYITISHITHWMPLPNFPEKP